MRYQKIIFLLSMMIIIAAILTGCGKYAQMDQAAGLREQPADKLVSWGIPGQLKEQGSGNTCRVVAGDKWNNIDMLELAAGGSGSLEYFLETGADLTTLAQFNLQFLSTQGIGRIKLAALDEYENTIATVGWVVTGNLPANSATAKWIDARSSANYKGDWMQATYNFADIFAKELAPQQLIKPEKYRLSIEVAQGQHVLIKQFSLGQDKAKAIKIIPRQQTFTSNVGDTAELKLLAVNQSKTALQNIEIKLIEPYGYGVATANPVQIIDDLQPGESKELVWQLSIRRADSVNLNKPWQVGFAVNGAKTSEAVSISAVDNRPGKVFYVMTEDLEPIDSAGYPAAWGNKNGWLDADEYLVQMVYKAEALNNIAEQYGAKWTHYIAWPAVKAAEWAAGQSSTGKWQQTVAAIKQSVISQSQKGHEYGIHLHSDYDPYLPGNVLSYNREVDGLWANHLKHGWAHSVFDEGDFNNYASRVGLLYNYRRILDDLAKESPQGQILTARAGSFDFGDGSTEEAKSTAAFYKTGLWGSTDADGNAGGITSGDYGQEIYFAAPDDINAKATNLGNLGIVEFKPTPRDFINYDSQSAVVMNNKVDQGMNEFIRQDQVKPGIHAIVGFTHAMFIMGDGDWTSVQGGQFDVINQHLAYLKTTYVDTGKLIFGTATQLVAAYLDYYTPKPIAIYGKIISSNRFCSEYELKILGHDIVIDEIHPHKVAVKYPLYKRDSAYRITILKNGSSIYSTWGLPTPHNDIEFIVDDAQAKYTMKIYHDDTLFWLINKIRHWREKVHLAVTVKG